MYSGYQAGVGVLLAEIESCGLRASSHLFLLRVGCEVGRFG
jgi:hypothetical protein